MVLAGRDAQQNEALVSERPNYIFLVVVFTEFLIFFVAGKALHATRRHLRSRRLKWYGDTYNFVYLCISMFLLICCACVRVGAATCVLRNKSKSAPVSPIALQEAATMAVCHSVAWSSKAISSAWWVHSHQVRCDFRIPFIRCLPSPFL